MASQRIVVTGAAGFIGSHTVDALLRAGHSVVGVDNFRTGKAENLVAARPFSAFRLVEGDVTNEQGFDAIAAEFRPQAIIHLAALVSVPESMENPEENFRINVVGTECVARVARRHGVGRLVFASSAAVYGTDTREPLDECAPCAPQSPYGAAKLAAEGLLLGYARSFNSVVRCQRFFNVYGPRQDPSSAYSGVISRFAARARAGQNLMVHGDGEQTRDFVFVGDVAEANLRAATLPNLRSGVANICTGRGTSLKDLIAALGEAVGSKLAIDYSPARPGDIRGSIGRPDRAAREFGFQPCVSLAHGLGSYLADLHSPSSLRS
jgi:UDP-glucose 4-epimerase